MTDAKCYQATPHGTLLEQIMDSTQPKNEREWAAMREIERNRAAIGELVSVLAPFARLLLDAEHLSSRSDSAMVFGINNNGFNVGDLRNACAAIAKHDTSTTREQQA